MAKKKCLHGKRWNTIYTYFVYYRHWKNPMDYFATNGLGAWN